VTVASGALWLYVMAGLDPAIHVAPQGTVLRDSAESHGEIETARSCTEARDRVDGRIKSGHDECMSGWSTQPETRSA
jgi:hypothetical protein